MTKYKISAVSYLNTLPFIYGLKRSDIINQINLELDIPSDCAEKLLKDKVDIGLVPVAIIPQLNEHHIISNYCIGAEGKVNSVLLLSDVPLSEIEEILLDYQSKTSVNLVQILAKEFWKISPKWVITSPGFEGQIGKTTAGVIIGDRTFTLNKDYKYQYDLSDEWKKMTGLPFVFACWVSNKKIENDFLLAFNKALELGLNKIEDIVKENYTSNISSEKLSNYLTNDINYDLDNKKKLAIENFLHYIQLKQKAITL